MSNSKKPVEGIVVARKYPKEWSDKPFIPKGFTVMKKVDSREVKCLKSLLRKLKKEMGDPLIVYETKRNAWNAGIALCIGEIKARIEKESKVKHYERG